MALKKKPAPQGKSPVPKKPGLKRYSQGELIFREGESANALYIIKEGQIRLFRPKGKGFIEIAILRKGEVIGEMAYFDTANKRRSCSASALTALQIIEIPFDSLDKALKGLNPWFKTIVITLADRLRKTNNQLKELESNSVGYASKGKAAQYTFFTNTDIVKGLSLLFTTFKTFGNFNKGEYKLNKSTLKVQMNEMNSYPEIKLEELLRVLKELKYVEEKKAENGEAILLAYKMSQIHEAVVFFNKERRTEDSKKLKIPEKTETLLIAVLLQLKTAAINAKGKAEVNISKILDKFKEKKVPVFVEDFTPAVEQGFAEEIYFDNSSQMISVINVKYLESSMPAIQMRNYFDKVNREKADQS